MPVWVVFGFLLWLLGLGIVWAILYGHGEPTTDPSVEG